MAFPTDPNGRGRRGRPRRFAPRESVPRHLARVRPRMDPSIFKAYDVRGVYGEQLDPDDAYRIGRAFARVLSDEEGKPVEELTIGLGRDMRLTAPEMAARYADGIRDEGADVIDVGMVGTEMLYFA